MVPATKVEKAGQTLPGVLPADFAAWDESQDAPAVLPDDFNGFDVAVHEPHKIEERRQIEAAKLTSRQISQGSGKIAHDSTPEASVKIHPARQWKSNVNAQVTKEENAPLSDRQVMEETAEEDGNVFVSADVFSGQSRTRVGVICGAAVLLFGSVAMYMGMHSKSAPHHASGSMVASQAAMNGDKKISIDESAVTTNTQGAESSNGTSLPEGQKIRQEQQASAVQAPQGVEAKSNMHVAVLPQMNATSQIASKLNRSGNEKEPAGQINMTLNSDYGVAYTHDSHPAVQLAMPSQVSVSMPKSLSLATYRPEPVYPEIAKRARMEGEVEIRVIVSKTGEVKSASIVSGQKMLQGAALDTIKKWHYQPYRINNQPVEMSTTVRFNFHLKQ